MDLTEKCVGMLKGHLSSEILGMLQNVFINLEVGLVDIFNYGGWGLVEEIYYIILSCE